jgi:hypothetical protein
MCVRARDMIDCPPLYATARDPSRPTLGGDVAAIAAQLGTPFMAWQRQVADVAMELDPATGLLAYREVDLTTPRQSGKTTLELAVLVHRCRTWARSRALYSAQSRIHARLKWEDDHVATLDRSAFAGEYQVRYQRGDEAIRWRNGSRHGITAPGEKAGHSDVLDLAVADEAWGLEDSRLEQGLSPTMITRPSRGCGSSPPPAPTARRTCAARSSAAGAAPARPSPTSSGRPRPAPTRATPRRGGGACRPWAIP